MQPELVAGLGELYRPLVSVNFWSEPDRDWQQVSMIVDTGADYTLLPTYMARFLGLNLNAGQELETVGIGGKQKVWLIEDVSVKLGSFQRQIPVGIVSGKVPPLMGRFGFFETFTTTFDKNRLVRFEN